MLIEIDTLYQRFLKLEQAILAALAEQPNESDTRLKALDRILFEVLDWRHESILTEPSTESGYIDYLLTIGERRGALIVEAKRSGLLAPNTTSNKLITVTLSGPVVKPLLPGIRQSLAYASEQGAPMAVLTDGRCWLFFKASRTDGLKPLDGKALLFPSFEAVKENFSTFAELLAPSFVIERRHLAHLSSTEGNSVVDTEEHFFLFNPSEAKMRPRDAVAHDSSRLFSQFFSRLSNKDDKEMMTACFVETAESQKADFELQKIVQKVLNGISSIETRQGSALQEEIERTLVSMHSETVLLVGNKGSGKSTFIGRFFDQILPPSVRQRCAVARVDLEIYSGSPERVVSWAINQLRDMLELAVCSHNPPSYDDLQGVFWGEYQRWRDGARKPLYDSNKEKFKIAFGEHMEARREQQPEEYVRLLLNRAANGLNKLPCIVFDNTDQFPSEVQDAVYQLAHSLESASPIFTIVPITDRTVWRLSKAGALQSYAAKSFYLPVPEAKEIISRRVHFVKEQLSKEQSAAAAYFSRKGFHVSLQDLSVFADAVERIFVESDYISGLIGRLANFDIRRMLRLAERIFVSPEIKIDDIVKAKYGGPSVSSDRYRTHRALIKGEYDRFSEAENEYVSNIFYTDPKKPTSPLLAFYILWILRQRANGARSDDIESRHWFVSELCDFFEGCGVPLESVVDVVERLYERRLIETLDPNIDKVSLADRVAIKENGIAHIDLVISSPVYVEQMALSTGINARTTRDELKQRVIHPSRQSFLEMRDLFVQYVLRVDSVRVTIPSAQQYRQLTEARAFIRNSRTLDRPTQCSPPKHEFTPTPKKVYGTPRRSFKP
ncbi:hypothetical protein Jab_2c25360 [Janthinobacterium sp. HH01]|uniref:ATP-binding protein n=1 Tax=Janthinobacterium sp. HH01 TaxID=1198452 RepID=UPI0002AEB021|nr:ATP-binding protein [Janthinobacterium sp. HH01]ELX10445.1 hypothetical protein Jab_2c25360 [Janthinobacterium sp. HH01]